MTTTLNDVVSQMRRALAVTDPDLDTSIGTTTRKILDAVGESIAESYLDRHMLAYVYDVDSKVDGDLDSFCQAVGGISRLSSKRATGTVTFTRSGVSTATVFIPVNAQVSSNSSPSIPCQTLSGAAMLPGQLSVTVAVQSVTAGPDGNVAANSLTMIATQIEGVSIATNINALTGGMSQETDSELRQRWRKTAFRSNAGTEQMYLGLALDDISVTAAQVIGASKRRREQVQISGGVGASTVDDCSYSFPTGVYVGSNIDDGTIMLNGIDYWWDTTVSPPRVVINAGVTTYDTGNLDEDGNHVHASLDNAVLDLDYEYTPSSSRNDPTGERFGGPAVMNRVDVWCAGQRPISAQQSVVFQSSKRFTDDNLSPYHTGKFLRLNGSRPIANAVYLPLAYGPIIAIPDQLTVGGVTYGRIGAPTVGITYPNTYAVIHDDSPFGYTSTSGFGLEWAAANLPTTNTVFTIGSNSDYLYNEVPRSVQAQIDRWRLVGVDAKVHAAKEVHLRFSLALMYDRSANQQSVNGAIDTALSDHLGKVGLGGVVQVSDIQQVVHNVAGVDNVRFLHSLDYPTWTYGTSNNFNLGIQRVVDGLVVETYVTSGGQFKDISYGDSEIPTFESCAKVVKAQNTFRS
jgi:uncharacterized phage protein gp47/JayE